MTTVEAFSPTNTAAVFAILEYKDFDPPKETVPTPNFFERRARFRKLVSELRGRADTFLIEASR